MEVVSFDKLILRTAFCCMASDGNIDKREIAQIRTMCENYPSFQNIDFEGEINSFVNDINKNSKQFILSFFEILENSNLIEQEELALIDFAIQTIKADEQIEYSEIKFFKNIRHRLKVRDERILEIYPGLEQFLEEDIVTDAFLTKITKQYLDVIELPQFELINIDSLSN